MSSQGEPGMSCLRSCISMVEVCEPPAYGSHLTCKWVSLTPLILMLQNHVILWSFGFGQTLPREGMCSWADANPLFLDNSAPHLNSKVAVLAELMSPWSLISFSISKSDQLQASDISMNLSLESWGTDPGLGWIHQAGQPSSLSYSKVQTPLCWVSNALNVLFKSGITLYTFPK